ncbi:hypothetical protein MKQ68_12695 [Chitinophaga horti]|uniref:Lipoprotein n=1 Tax=Chitinophaga horti TaxID=2920382 RepID=A0ABY6IX27_9BACT|nr:hypothetical protein [Chitinophaga horti]UYQ90952.1 hypothetical protein MKQ68_12695 [Chitinophaga horti]
MRRSTFPSLIVACAGLFACNNASKSPAARDTAAAVNTDVAVPVDTSVVVEDTTVSLIRTVLQNELKANLPSVDSADRQFSYTQADLNSDGKQEIFVGFRGMYFCGNAGCSMMLLAHDGKVISRFTLVRTPVYVLKTATKGWNDLLIDTKGGMRIVKWTGSKYPGNPSVQPAFQGDAPPDAIKVLDAPAWTAF